MTPLHPRFRRLVRKYIPQLDNEDLDRYDGLVALRLELLEQRSLLPPKPPEEEPPDIRSAGRKRQQGESSAFPAAGSPREELDAFIDRVTRAANAILAGVREEFDAVHRLWMARRQLAYKQGGLLQIPTSWEELTGFVGALFNYYRVQASTFPILLGKRIKNLSAGKILFYAAMVGVLSFSLCNLAKQDDGRKPQPPGSGTVTPDTTGRQNPPRVIQ